MKLSDLAADLRPLLATMTNDSVVGATTTGAVEPHDHTMDTTGGLLDHGMALVGLGDDDHPQYLTIERHDTSARHGASVVDHGSIGGLGDDDHTQYLNLTRHDTTSRHGSTVVDHGLIGGLSDDDHAQYLNITRHDTFTRHGATSVDHGQINGLGDDDHTQYLLVNGSRAYAGNFLPDATDTRDIGSSTLLWRKGWLSELDAVLFAQNTATLLGGWFIISKDEGKVGAAVTAAATTIDFGKAMTQNDFVLFRAAGQVEYVQVGTLVSGTTYNVTRNLDGSGANAWPDGSIFCVLGGNGQGRIELNAYDTPRISVLTQGATYNAQTEMIRLGDLASWQSAGLTGYGMAMGSYSGNEYMYYTPGSGLVIRGSVKADDGYLNTLDVTGTLTVKSGGTLLAGTAGGARIQMTSAELGGYNSSNVKQFYLDATTGLAKAGNGMVTLSSSGLWVGSPNADNSGTVWLGDYGTQVKYGYLYGSLYSGVASTNAVQLWSGNGTQQSYVIVGAGGGNTKLSFFAHPTPTSSHVDIGSEGNMFIHSDYSSGNNYLEIGSHYTNIWAAGAADSRLDLMGDTVNIMGRSGINNISGNIAVWADLQVAGSLLSSTAVGGRLVRNVALACGVGWSGVYFNQWDNTLSHDYGSDTRYMDFQGTYGGLQARYAGYYLVTVDYVFTAASAINARCCCSIILYNSAVTNLGTFGQGETYVGPYTTGRVQCSAVVYMHAGDFVLSQFYNGSSQAITLSASTAATHEPCLSAWRIA